MTKLQSQKLAMYMAALRVLRNHPSLIESAPALEPLIAELERLLAEIQHTAGLRRTLRTGISQAKAMGRAEIIRHSFAVSQVILAWAVQNGDVKRAQRHQTSVSALWHVRQVELPALATTVLEEARNLGAALEPFGLGPTRLSELEGAISNFRELISQPRTALGDQRLATKTLALLFREVDDLLSGRIDPMVRAQGDTALADAHSRYLSARRIAGARRYNGSPDPVTEVEASAPSDPVDPAAPGLRARLPMAAW